MGKRTQNSPLPSRQLCVAVETQRRDDTGEKELRMDHISLAEKPTIDTAINPEKEREMGLHMDVFRKARDPCYCMEKYMRN